MTPEERESMYILCERIVKEKDLERFAELVQQLHGLLETKERRLEAQKESTAASHKTVVSGDKLSSRVN
jgi:hypothetical protein